eukprot:Phypoly_transcript_06468.p1 GENE.Phypoly_transcript_06468~~Phypoly_transcript_06468.p1  ORF type:complete len:554 (+),score=76.17 Phypoly_transcript_06468:75-1736(+)
MSASSSTTYSQAAQKVESYNPFVEIPKRVHAVENIHDAGDKWIRSCQSNHIVVIRNCSNVQFTVGSNQRVHIFYLIDCKNVTFTILDSVVIASRSCRAINCINCTFVFEDVDMRHFECYGVKNSMAVFIDSPPVVENSKVHWRAGCSGNLVQLGRLRPKSENTTSAICYNIIQESPAPDAPGDGECTSEFDEVQHISHRIVKSDVSAAQVDTILRDLEELEKTPFTLTKDELTAAYDKERDEFEEPMESLKEKVKEVAAILKNSKHTVCYTGAGVSTSANIPDFRGPQGVWTLKAKGMTSAKAFAEDVYYPTLCHYGITELARRNLINFVTTTNMDALHLRSGLPNHLICEQHGNGNKERCTKCHKSFYRQYRTTYSTDFFTHCTGRFCDFCGGELRDTIVNFSEVLADQDMLISLFHARKSEAALVLGTSMNVQPAASFPDKCFRNDGKLIIVNLQKTPYDSAASVRIYAKTDVFMNLLLEELGVNELDTATDKITTWDPPTDDTPLPLSARKRYDQEKRKKRMQWWVSVASVAVLVVGVVVGVAVGATKYR